MYFECYVLKTIKFREQHKKKRSKLGLNHFTLINQTCILTRGYDHCSMEKVQNPLNCYKFNQLLFIVYVISKAQFCMQLNKTAFKNKSLIKISTLA